MCSAVLSLERIAGSNVYETELQATEIQPGTHTLNIMMTDKAAERRTTRSESWLDKLILNRRHAKSMTRTTR